MLWFAVGAICVGGVSSCPELRWSFGGTFPLLGAYSEGRGGAGISALLGSMLIVLAVQDGWGGVCAVPSDRCSQNLCLCVDTVGSVWL